jgi:hypothetical protein
MAAPRVGTHTATEALERLHVSLVRLANAELNDQQVLTSKFRAAVQQWGSVTTALILAETFGYQDSNGYATPGADGMA